MGAWGPGLYQDDVACDVKSDYLNRLKVGMTNQEATEEVIEYNIDFIEDEEDGPIFWMALAETQWKYGRLLPEVKEEALRQISLGTDLERWKENPKQYKKRKEVLDQLKEKLESQQPPEKKVSKIKFDRALWQIGEILSHQITNSELIDSPWYGKYIALRVVSTSRTNIGSLPQDIYYNEQSIIALYNWVGDTPIDTSKVNQLEFAQDIDIFNRLTDVMFAITEYDKNLNFVSLKKDELYQSPLPKEISCVGIEWPNINNFDFSIVHALECSKQNGTLIDETTKK